MAWFKREPTEIQTSEEKRVRTEGLWVKCDFHFRIDAPTRVALLLDEGSYQIRDESLASTDPLQFSDTRPYKSRLQKSQAETGLKDAIINAEGTLQGRPVIISAMEYSFIGGSMGAVVGEAITRAIERACEQARPIIVISASGGARMMEGVISLMQMAKISAALARLDDARVPYISV